jgi:hypothetical protein
MTTNNVLSFTFTGTSLIAKTVPALARTDLHALPAHAVCVTDTFRLFGENVLLPAEKHPRYRYAYTAYVVSQDGRKALPVVCCRGWFQAPLPTQAPGHPVWADLRGGLAAAAERLEVAPYDLNGAVIAARSWMRSMDTARYERSGSEVLLGRDFTLYCNEQPESPPPQAARIFTMPTQMVRPVPQNLEMLAA